MYPECTRPKSSEKLAEKDVKKVSEIRNRMGLVIRAGCAATKTRHALSRSSCAARRLRSLCSHPNAKQQPAQAFCGVFNLEGVPAYGRHDRGALRRIRARASARTPLVFTYLSALL